MTLDIKEIEKKIDRAIELVPIGDFYDDSIGSNGILHFVFNISFDCEYLPAGYRYMMYSKDDSFTDYFFIKEVATVYDYVRIKPEDFPKYEELSLQQTEFLTNKILELLRAYCFEVIYPIKFPKKKLYPLLLNAMFKEFLFYDLYFNFTLNLCNSDYKNCVFGRRYCKCRKDARIMRRLIRKGILVCDESEPDENGERSYYLAPHIKTKPIDDDYFD